MNTPDSLNYETLFEMVSKAIIVADPQCKVIYANPDALKLLELDHSKIQGLDLTTIFEIDDKFLKQIKNIPSSEKTEYVSTLYHYSETDCASLKLCFKSLPLPTNDQVGLYLELEKEANIEFSGDELKKLGTKIGKIAHDFSNPLAVLKMQSQNFSLLAQKQDPIPSENIIERLKKMIRATDRLSVSTEDLKKLSRSLSGLKTEEIKDLLSEDSNSNET